MFDLGAAELLLVAIVALLVIGPKELPGAMRGVGKTIGQFRSIASQFTFNLDAVIREAEMEEQEKEWAKKNADIMAEHPPQDDDQTAHDPATEDKPSPDPMDGEMKPLKPIATDDTGGVSSVAESEPEPDNASDDEGISDGQDDLFGDKR